VFLQLSAHFLSLHCAAKPLHVIFHRPAVALRDEFDFVCLWLQKIRFEKNVLHYFLNYQNQFLLQEQIGNGLRFYRGEFEEA
jgi:hypothetical protein